MLPVYSNNWSEESGTPRDNIGKYELKPCIVTFSQYIQRFCLSS